MRPTRCVPVNLSILTLFNLVIAVSFVSSEPFNKFGRSERQVKKGRISEQKCQEYTEKVYRQITYSNLPYPLNQPKIGPLRCPSCHKPLIAGGKDALFCEFPHMVSLMYQHLGHRNGAKLSHDCGGTLISEKFVLTAAHCIETGIGIGPPRRALLGDASLVKKWSSIRLTGRLQIQRKEIDIKRTYVHPKYNPAKRAYHDIALVELSEDIKLAYSTLPMIRPACLAQPDQFKPLHEVNATGWGMSGSNDIRRGNHHTLQKVSLTVTPTLECAEYHSAGSNPDLRDGITSGQICAGGHHGRDTCFGDSGGPIQISRKDLHCMQYVVGVTSLGSAHCGSGGLFTRVDKYLDWIEGIVWKQ